MIWSAAQEFMSQLLRSIIYGKVDGTSGTTQQAVPILTNSEGKVFTTGRLTHVNLLDETLAGILANPLYTSWVNTNEYKGIGWFLQCTGFAALSRVIANYASGPNGTGIVSRDETIVTSVASGAAIYIDWVDTGAGLNQPNAWHPGYFQSMRLGTWASGFASDARVVAIGCRW